MGLGCLPERPALARPTAYRPAYHRPGPLGTLARARRCAKSGFLDLEISDRYRTTSQQQQTHLSFYILLKDFTDDNTEHSVAD